MLGVLWDISKEDIAQLDALEGYPTYYTRKNIKILYNNLLLDGFVYVMNDQSYELVPGQGYFNLCIQGYESNRIPLKQLLEAYESARSSTWSNVNV